jgi:cation:H+ antiporter
VLWTFALAVALFSSDRLVHHLAGLGALLRMSAGLLGLLVALGADGPEVTSALIALAQGHADIGLGVVIGSNIYNLAGLLGLSAILAGAIFTGRHRLSLDGATNLIMTVLLVSLVLLPSLHRLLGAFLLLALGLYSVTEARMSSPESPSGRAERGSENDQEVHAGAAAVSSPNRLILYSVAAATGIIVGSYGLVSASIALGPAAGIPSSIIGTFILPVTTSLPNTWAAISLARRGLASATIATTFNSNSINAAVGTGLPSLFFSVHASHATRVIDMPWLLGMTVVALVLVATRGSLARWEGSLVLALYAAFVVVRLTLFP